MERGISRRYARVSMVTDSNVMTTKGTAMTPVLRSIVLALACVAIVPLVTNAGAPQTDPLDILRRVDAAAKAIGNPQDTPYDTVSIDRRGRQQRKPLQLSL